MLGQRHIAKKDTMRYRILNGLNYPPHGEVGAPERRVEPGEIVDDLPSDAVDDLLEGKDIEPEFPEKASPATDAPQDGLEPAPGSVVADSAATAPEVEPAADQAQEDPSGDGPSPSPRKKR